MVPVVLVGHGGLPAGLRHAAEMILGEQDRLGVVSLPPDGDPDAVHAELVAVLDQLGGTAAGALVLADLFGGSPANAAGRLALADPKVAVVAGASLPMLLEVLTSAEETADGLAAVAVESGRTAVTDVGAQLRAAVRG
ncbi:MAG: PTS sugar transporter subunit IIA [Mycobacteriales bacterium]